MGDLWMQGQDRLVQFLRLSGPQATRTIANHFDWNLAHTREALETLQRRHLIESHTMAGVSAREWNVID